MPQLQAHQDHEGTAPPDAVHRQADAHGTTSSRSREARGRRAARPRQRLARAAPGRALARRADRATTRATPLDRRAPRAPTCSSCAASSAHARKDAAARARAAQRPRLPRAVPVHPRSTERWLTTVERRCADRVRIGLVSISDRASSGVYEDKGIPALQDWLARARAQPGRLGNAPDPRRAGGHQRRRCASWSTRARCDLVLTTGGTGPGAARRHARGDARRRRQGDAGLRRADAPDQPRASCRPRSCRARSR